MAGWFWLAVTASIFWGATYAINQYLLRYLDPLIVIFLSTFSICTLLGIYISINQGWAGTLSKFSAHHKLILAMVCYAALYFIASLLILKSINAGNASLAAIVECIYPLFTIPFAYLILREVQFNWGMIVGAALILSGLVVVKVTNSH